MQQGPHGLQSLTDSLTGPLQGKSADAQDRVLLGSLCGLWDKPLNPFGALDGEGNNPAKVTFPEVSP